MKQPTKIFLLGFMGSGKSTLGKRLANKLQKSFVDLDDAIVEHEQKTISELFEQHGEEYFRTIERAVLQQLIEKQDDIVVSLGGGTPCFYDNMEMINKAGVSVYLKYNAGMLASRLMHSKTERPLIKGKTADELRLFVQKKLEEREPYYTKSHLILEKTNIKVDDLIELLK